MSNVFLQASKQKLRLSTTSGLLAVDDLWDLSLKKLDQIAVETDSRLKKSTTSFLENPSRPSAEALDDALRLEVLKVVIEVKQTENKTAREAAAKASQVAFLKDLLNQKELKNLQELSVEDIQKQLAELQT